ncbi:MAG: hypothetical protein JSR54_03810 [Proteobacteria bacterium]|nr:hypothetical protein [Pseudomonadota bacterium]
MTTTRSWQPATVLALLALAFSVAPTRAEQRLSFDVLEGENLNSFLREGPVAAHVLLRSGREPRLLVVFPAGNSGAGVWFARTGVPVRWSLQGRPEPVVERDEQGRPLYGVRFAATLTGGELVVRQALLTGVRLLRDFQTLGKAPAEVMVEATTSGSAMSWSRERLDGALGYRLRIAVTDGAINHGRIEPGTDGAIGLVVTALSGERPLTPLPTDQLLSSAAGTDLAARDALTFLSYREKFLAGSWRFNTYFGRDTLMSVRLLMPALTPLAVESGLGAVLTRLSDGGEVAHEEDIGESALLDHRAAGEALRDAPVFNYTMIDGNYMLAPVVAAWLLDDPRGRGRAAAFLAERDGREGGSARPFGADLVSNLRLVLRSAQAFADDPTAAHLLALKAGRDSGQWRDSGEGLGRGRIPYDVNAVFMPAALAAASELGRSGLLAPYLGAADRALFARAAAMRRTWQAKAPPLFDVQIANPVARAAVAAYGRSVGVPSAAADASLGSRPVRFHALALNADVSPVPIVHSDEGFELLLGRPSAAELDEALTATLRPFPAGLMTDVGLLVANPVFAPAEVQARFSKNAYHGTVVWSWQQALLAAGLARQLQRTDLPAPTRRRLRAAQAQLWAAIRDSREMRNSELWSWAWADGRYHVAPFGADQADADESNAAQLWSTVYLAIPEPASR